MRESRPLWLRVRGVLITLLSTIPIPACSLNAGEISPAPLPSFVASPAAATSAIPSTTRTPVPRFPQIASAALPAGTYAIPLGQTATLRLPSNAIEPSLLGTAVLLVRRHSESRTSYREWELRAVSTGVAELTVSGPSTRSIWRIEVGQ